MALTPEQAAVWSYPLTDGNEEEVIFNMVNALLLRIHQSGHLINIGDRRFALVKEAIACYKKIRQDIKEAVPFWPLGFSDYKASWSALGLRRDNRDYIAVWHRDGSTHTVTLPVPARKGMDMKVKCIYPQAQNSSCQWNRESGLLTVSLPSSYCARLFELGVKGVKGTGFLKTYM